MKCPIHPRYKGLKPPTSKRIGCYCMNVYNEQKSKVRILLQQDDSCEMEQLTVNGTQIGFGNLSDNHCVDRLDAIEKTLKLLKIPFTSHYDSKWDYLAYEKNNLLR